MQPKISNTVTTHQQAINVLVNQGVNTVIATAVVYNWLASSTKPGLLTRPLTPAYIIKVYNTTAAEQITYEGGIVYLDGDPYLNSQGQYVN